jgi:hypothetical protein
MGYGIEWVHGPNDRDHTVQTVVFYSNSETFLLGDRLPASQQRLQFTKMVSSYVFRTRSLIQPTDTRHTANKLFSGCMAILY